MQQNVKKRNLMRRIARLSLYIIPFYPVFKTAQSIRRTAGLGISEWRHRRARLAEARKRPRVVTFREALANRPADALPLEVIQRDRLMRKRMALAFSLLSLPFLIHAYILSLLLGLLFVVICSLNVIKFEHQLWQIETGLADPDRPLGGLRTFLATPHVWVRCLNPRFFQLKRKQKNMYH